ncbi:MAG TPA: hypothetical protein VNA26_03630 [Chitinophagaceae bacterium]|nr:hypothetical protein [Chitinophagaceae bacterium]
MKLFSFLTVVLGLIALGGCSKKTSPEVIEAGQTYYFYPKANVYFDTTVGNYIFQGPDGGWHANAKLPAEKQTLLEKNIIISNPELPVWKNNDAHQLLYSAALYSTSADFKEKEKIAVNKKDAVTDEKIEEDSKDNKTGLGKFFNKIFKGKKERQEKENGKPDTSKSAPIP